MNGFSSALTPCRIIGTRGLSSTPKLQKKKLYRFSDINRSYVKIIGDKAFVEVFFLSLGNLFAINQVYLRFYPTGVSDFERENKIEYSRYYSKYTIATRSYETQDGW